MTDAERIIYYGGPTKLAKRLKFEMPDGRVRVQNWLKRGIPATVKLAHPELFIHKISAARLKAAVARQSSNGIR